MKIKLRIMAWAICLLAVFTLLPQSALAAGLIEPEKDVTLTISYQDGRRALSGTTFSFYRVADVDAYARMTLVDDFSSYPISIDGLEEDGWQELALTLKGYVRRDSLRAETTGRTDRNGMLTVTLKPGLYLVVGGRCTAGGKYTYSAVPFMIFLPDRNLTDNVWDYTLTVSPKFHRETVVPTPDPVTRKVLKIWDDAGYEELRPAEVTIQLLRDDKVYDTQTLSKRNNWRYTWKDLSTKYEWTVVEENTEGYYTRVALEGITFTVTNTIKEPTPTDSPDEPKPPENPKPQKPTLPQTGVLWWPVPVLFAAGAALCFVGVVRKKLDNDEA